MAVKRKKKREATQEDWDRDASIQKDRVMGYGMHPVLSTTLLTIWAFSVLVLFVLGYQACEFFGISGPDASPVAIVLVLIIIPLTLWILEMVLIGKFIKRKDQNRINDLVVNGKCRRVVVQGSSAWQYGRYARHSLDPVIRMEQSYYSRLTKRWRVAATYNDRKGKEVKVYSFALWYNPDKYLDYGFEANYYYDDKKIGYLDLSGYLPGYVGSEYEREG